MLEMLPIFFHLHIKMATQKFTNFDKFFLNHVALTAVTIQSHKIALNEVKDSEALLEPSYGKKQMNFLADAVVTLIIGCEITFAQKPHLV